MRRGPGTWHTDEHSSGAQKALLLTSIFLSNSRVIKYTRLSSCLLYFTVAELGPRVKIFSSAFEEVFITAAASHLRISSTHSKDHKKAGTYQMSESYVCQLRLSYVNAYRASSRISCVSPQLMGKSAMSLWISVSHWDGYSVEK
jgi:hypothetical protein